MHLNVFFFRFHTEFFFSDEQFQTHTKTEKIVYNKSPYTHYPHSTIIKILPHGFEIKSKSCNLLFIPQLVQSINKHLRKTGRTKISCAFTMC